MDRRWEGPKHGQDVMAKRKMSSLAGIEFQSSSPQPIILADILVYRAVRKQTHTDTQDLAVRFMGLVFNISNSHSENVLHY
jgi:hypothetical protein